MTGQGQRTKCCYRVGSLPTSSCIFMLYLLIYCISSKTRQLYLNIIASRHKGDDLLSSNLRQPLKIVKHNPVAVSMKSKEVQVELRKPTRDTAVQSTCGEFICNIPPWGSREHCTRILVTPLTHLNNTLPKSECKRNHLASSCCLKGESLQQ